MRISLANEPRLFSGARCALDAFVLLMFDCALLLVARLSVLDIILAPFVWNFPEKSLVACVDVGDGVDAPAGVFSSRQDIDTSSGGSVSVESGSSLKTIQRYRALLREAREAAPPRPTVRHPP